ncbi:MAG: DUF3784 domain-containing protein [Eubacteriales bacterium]
MYNFIVPAIFFALSVVLLTGKGSWLIAGYNTSSKEEKSKYDSKKLSRAAGIMLLIVTFSVILITFLNSQVITVLCTVIILVSVLFTIVYMNTKCKKADGAYEKSTNTPNQKNKIRIIIAVIVVAVVFGSMVYTNQATVYLIKNGTFEISTMFGETINLSDINSMQIKSELPTIKEKINGAGLGNILKGEFSSDSGNIMLFVDTSIKSYIYINTKSGLIILNDQSVNKTQDLYNELLSETKK